MKFFVFDRLTGKIVSHAGECQHGMDPTLLTAHPDHVAVVGATLDQNVDRIDLLTGEEIIREERVIAPPAQLARKQRFRSYGDQLDALLKQFALMQRSGLALHPELAAIIAQHAQVKADIPIGQANKDG